MYNKLGLALGKLAKNQEEMEVYDLSIRLNPKLPILIKVIYTNPNYLSLLYRTQYDTIFTYMAHEHNQNY